MIPKKFGCVSSFAMFLSFYEWMKGAWIPIVGSMAVIAGLQYLNHQIKVSDWMFRRFRRFGLAFLLDAIKNTFESLKFVLACNPKFVPGRSRRKSLEWDGMNENRVTLGLHLDDSGEWTLEESTEWMFFFFHSPRFQRVLVGTSTAFFFDDKARWRWIIKKLSVFVLWPLSIEHGALSSVQWKVCSTYL